MAITYTWKVTSLKVQNVSDNKQNAIVQTYWKKIGTDENGNEGVFNGATPFTVDPSDNSGPFVAFEDLQEEDVLNWIKSVVVGSYEEHVNGVIQAEIEKILKPITERPAPWMPQEPSANTSPPAPV